jgi:Calcineurin-like phosphoesterase
MTALRIQLLSDLHLETETFDPKPAPGADVLVLAGDIDSSWRAYERFSGWPVPVIVVGGNHEFDRRDVPQARHDFRAMCERLGLLCLEQRSVVVPARDGRRIRFLGAIRWTDFSVFGQDKIKHAIKVGAYFQRVMGATQDGLPFDAEAVRQEALIAKKWLEAALLDTSEAADATVVITHFAPSLRSADPRYGQQISTAGFCNNDEALMPGVDLWMHGHVHVRHDYVVSGPAADGAAEWRCRVVSQARGLQAKGECEGYDAFKLIDV